MTVVWVHIYIDVDDKAQKNGMYRSKFTIVCKIIGFEVYKISTMNSINHTRCGKLGVKKFKNYFYSASLLSFIAAMIFYFVTIETVHFCCYYESNSMELITYWIVVNSNLKPNHATYCTPTPYNYVYITATRVNKIKYLYNILLLWTIHLAYTISCRHANST